MMLSKILGFFGGSASDIIKWTAIASVIALVGIVFNAFESKGELQGQVDAAQAALVVQTAEAEQANQALNEVVNEYATRDSEYEAKAKQAALYRSRALYAERKLVSLVAAGNTVAINERLCFLLRAIEGNHRDNGEALNCTDGTSSDASSKHYRISAQSVTNLLANLERIRSYIDQQEPVGVPDGSTSSKP